MNCARVNSMPERLRERPRGQGLAEAREVLEQHVTAGEDARPGPAAAPRTCRSRPTTTRCEHGGGELAGGRRSRVAGHSSSILRTSSPSCVDGVAPVPARRAGSGAAGRGRPSRPAADRAARRPGRGRRRSGSPCTWRSRRLARSAICQSTASSASREVRCTSIDVPVHRGAGVLAAARAGRRPRRRSTASRVSASSASRARTPAATVATASRATSAASCSTSSADRARLTATAASDRQDRPADPDAASACALMSPRPLVEIAVDARQRLLGPGAGVGRQRVGGEARLVVEPRERRRPGAGRRRGCAGSAPRTRWRSRPAAGRRRPPRPSPRGAPSRRRSRCVRRTRPALASCRSRSRSQRLPAGLDVRQRVEVEHQLLVRELAARAGAATRRSSRPSEPEPEQTSARNEQVLEPVAERRSPGSLGAAASSAGVLGGLRLAGRLVLRRLPVDVARRQLADDSVGTGGGRPAPAGTRRRAPPPRR